MSPSIPSTMKILHIDDHTLFRSGIQTMLSNLETETIIQGFSNCLLAINEVNQPLEISLILLDSNIPDDRASDNIFILKNYFENAKVVIVSGEDDAETIIETLNSGVSGFIPKSSDPQILIAALRLVIAGGIYLPEQVLHHHANLSSGAHSLDDEPAFGKLSKRQMEVLRHVIAGKNNKTIARELNLSLGTIKAHLSAAYTSLGVTNRTAAVAAASKLLM